MALGNYIPFSTFLNLSQLFISLEHDQRSSILRQRLEKL